METLSTAAALGFLRHQLAQWPMAAANFEALRRVETRTMEYRGRNFAVQHNPARIASTGAKVADGNAGPRPCFLCKANRPAEQLSFGLDHGYELLVNPFPIFPVHFTIPALDHTPQQLIACGRAERMAHMAEFAMNLPGLALFYNGARCGASAPDHFHFQAVEASRMPLLDWATDGRQLPFIVITFSAATPAETEAKLLEATASLPRRTGGEEPDINVICRADRISGGVQICVIPRKAHRPDFFGSAEGQILVSPASVDLAGTIILPRPEDFHTAFTPERLEALLAQTVFPPCANI